ncbi:hypothetical protein [Streptomyces sp. NPDC046887]|uniref:hypothetical protein n=1 Tax=Streptomyces sp. NPDC046887 TaxID=3155472 RepID=UPI0033D79832
MSPTRRTTALATLLLSLSLPLTGCGVPTSGVIEVGEPATGASSNTTVYFLADGELRPYPRGVPWGVEAVPAAVRLLFDGPAPYESGAVTRLPRLTTAPRTTLGRDGYTIHLPAGTPRLTPEAARQLVCTVTRTHDAALTGPPAPSPTTPTAAPPEAAPTDPPTPAPGTRAQLRVQAGDWSAALADEPCPDG